LAIADQYETIFASGLQLIKGAMRRRGLSHSRPAAIAGRLAVRATKRAFWRRKRERGRKSPFAARNLAEGRFSNRLGKNGANAAKPRWVGR
jgi:hypothetical protein